MKLTLLTSLIFTGLTMVSAGGGGTVRSFLFQFHFSVNIFQV